MARATELGFFGGAKIGRNVICIFHLQFTDDKIFIGDASISNAWTMKRLLKNMELVSGLRVKFDKCGLCGVNVGEARLNEMVVIVEYEVGKLPIPYLGIKIGMDTCYTKNQK